MRPLISYYGGKQRLATWIISHFPAHGIYIEPFCGGAAVFFAKEPVGMNLLNDTNGMIVNLYQQAKLYPEELSRLIDATPHSRSEYNRAAAIYKGKTPATDLEKAWAMYTATMQGFAHKPACGWAFVKGPVASKVPCTYVANRKRMIPDIFNHLNKAQIDCIDAIKCIERYDRVEALFYVDPPYVGTQQGTYAGYQQADFDRLLEVLKTIKGTFFLSHYANESMSEYVKANGWGVTEKQAVCSATMNRTDDSAKRTEILVTNHVPADLFTPEL